MNPFWYDVNGPGVSRNVARCVNINVWFATARTAAENRTGPCTQV